MISDLGFDWAKGQIELDDFTDPRQPKAEGPFCALCNQQIGYEQAEVVFHLDGKCR